MKLAHLRETKYEYQDYWITLDHYFTNTIGLSIVDPQGDVLEIDETIYDLENMAVIAAQDYIEKDMLKKVDKEKLEKAIDRSVEKWRCIEYSIEIPITHFVEIVLSDATDICGFCEQFSCRYCPVRSKCREVDKTFDRLKRQYDWCLNPNNETPCMTEDEWLITLQDIVDDILNFLDELRHEYLD
jgi:hypothetical protein